MKMVLKATVAGTKQRKKISQTYTDAINSIHRDLVHFQMDCARLEFGR